MKTLMLFFLILVSFPMAGYSSFPTNTAVTANRVPYSSGSIYSTINVSTFDQQRNQTKSYTSSLGVYNIPSVKDGVVIWVETYSQNIIFHFLVYDPKCGCWKKTQSSYSPGNAAAVSDGGVVGWTTITTTLAGIQNLLHTFAIYDPDNANWVQGVSPLSPRNTGGFVVSNTMVAWAEIVYPPSPNPPKIIFNFRIYDPTRKEWRGISTVQYNADGASYGIIASTGHYAAGGVNYRVGYNYVSGTFTTGSDTVPLAYFVPSNPSGSSPLKTYMWDMGLGATSWSYLFGDGGSSSNRSPFYTYQNVGVFTASQTVLGPSGSDTDFVQIDAY